ncbi:hypothetical protein D3C77_528870 [compost metagenome]
MSCRVRAVRRPFREARHAHPRGDRDPAVHWRPAGCRWCRGAASPVPQGRPCPGANGDVPAAGGVAAVRPGRSFGRAQGGAGPVRSSLPNGRPPAGDREGPGVEACRKGRGAGGSAGRAPRLSRPVGRRRRRGPSGLLRPHGRRRGSVSPNARLERGPPSFPLHRLARARRPDRRS